MSNRTQKRGPQPTGRRVGGKGTHAHAHCRVMANMSAKMYHMYHCTIRTTTIPRAVQQCTSKQIKIIIKNVCHSLLNAVPTSMVVLVHSIRAVQNQTDVNPVCGTVPATHPTQPQPAVAVRSQRGWRSHAEPFPAPAASWSFACSRGCSLPRR